MTQLKIEQDSDKTEIFHSASLQKLYNMAISVPTPNVGEEDAAQVSGHIQVKYTYKYIVEYLAGTIGLGEKGVVNEIYNNPSGRFQNLQIDVTHGYGVEIADPAVRNFLITQYGDEGFIPSTALSTIPSWFSRNKFSTFNELGQFPKVTYIGYCDFEDSGVKSIDLSNITSMHPLAFKYTSIKHLVLPAFTNVSENWFYKVRNGITTIDFGPNLRTIGHYAFWDSDVRTLIFRGTNPPSYTTSSTDPNSNQTQFIYSMSNLSIYVPSSAVYSYKYKWRDMSNRIFALEGTDYEEPGYTRV